MKFWPDGDKIPIWPTFLITQEVQGAMVINSVTPAWEVVLSVEGFSVATCAAFEQRDGKFIILVGVEDSAHVLAYADLIREAAFRVSVASNFRTIDEIREADSAGNETSPPF